MCSRLIDDVGHLVSPSHMKLLSLQLGWAGQDVLAGDADLRESLLLKDLDHLPLHTPLVCTHHLRYHRPTKQLRVPRKQHLRVPCRVSYHIVLVLSVLYHPHALLPPNQVIPRAVALEVSCYSPRPVLHYPALQLRHLCCNSSGSRVELSDVDNGELVLVEEIHSMLEIFFTFRREATDDVSCYSDIWHVLKQVIHQNFEIFSCVLSFHVLENLVTAALHRDVKELEDAGMVQHPRNRFLVL
mmetsp:Transcript_16119/g.54032  ORF Transcript_16119/g.54032 Transcript_16119/m.54032 type:complete len:242 (+) Transcript_16119:651-1376(+)